MFDVGAERTDTIRNLVTYDEDVTNFERKENGTIVMMSEAVSDDYDDDDEEDEDDDDEDNDDDDEFEFYCPLLFYQLGQKKN